MKSARWTTIPSVFLLSFCFAACSTPIKKGAVNPSNSYGPLTFNHAGADFYFSQDGKFARSYLNDKGTIEVHLKNEPFQFGYNGEQASIALAQIPISEISTDPQGFKASRLSGPMTGAGYPNSDALIVYSGKKWTDGNTEFSDETSMKASPMPRFQHAYQVNKLDFDDDRNASLSTEKGSLYGYIVVYKQHKRSNRDIMPISLIFDGSKSQ